MPDLPPPPDDRVPAAALIARLADIGATLSPARAALAAAAGVGLLAVVVFVAVGGASTPEPELTMPRADVAATTGSVKAPDESEDVFVHAAGAVGRPGVYRLAAGARVTDLIDAAGGPAPDADVNALNLAQRVNDGDRVYVPRVGEVAAPTGSAASGSDGASAGPIDLNRATEAELDELPGVGPATAKAIISYREQHGRFRSVEQLLEVRGIGDAKLAGLRDLVRV